MTYPFLGLMNHLAAKGLACPTPVRNKAGEMLGQLAGRPAAIVSFLDGIWVRRPQPKHCSALGRALAELHLAGRDFAVPRANALGVAGWRGLFDASQARANEVAKGLAEEVDAELAHFEKNWPHDLPKGVIHADLFPDNVFFIGDQLSGLIDFYFACNDSFAYDIAICLNAWCFESDGSFNITKARAMLQAYNVKRPLERHEMEALPLLARGAAMRFLLTRLYDWLNQPEGALVRPKNPLEYLRRLRFHRDVAGPQAYGLDI